MAIQLTEKEVIAKVTYKVQTEKVFEIPFLSLAFTNKHVYSEK